MLVGPDDLRVYLQLDSINEESALLYLDLAEGIARALINLPAPFDNRDMRLIAVVLEAAARAYRNPLGDRSESLGAETVQLAQQAPVYFTPDERALLISLRGARPAFGTIRLSLPLAPGCRW